MCNIPLQIIKKTPFFDRKKRGFQIKNKKNFNEIVFFMK